MIGNRTIIVAIVAWISSMTARYGFGIDAEIMTEVIMNMFPLLMIGMRAVTRTPVGKST